MAEGNGARSACSRRRKCTLAEGNRAGHGGSLRRYCAVRIFNRRRTSPWTRNRGNFCCVLLDRLAIGTRASCETNGGVPYSAAGGRVVCDVPPSSCQFRCGRYLVDARSGFRSGCGQPLSAFRERPREQKRRARVGHHHGSQTRNGYRGYICDCLPGLGPGGTPAFNLPEQLRRFFVVCAREDVPSRR